MESNGNYCIGVILGLYRDNGKENGNYHSILGIYSTIVLGLSLDLGPLTLWDSLIFLL